MNISNMFRYIYVCIYILIILNFAIIQSTLLDLWKFHGVMFCILLYNAWIMARAWVIRFPKKTPHKHYKEFIFMFLYTWFVTLLCKWVFLNILIHIYIFVHSFWKKNMMYGKKYINSSFYRMISISIWL